MAFVEDIKTKFKQGKFKTYARWGGVAAVIGLFLTCCFTLLSSCILNSIICMIIAILIGIIELPFCCSCFPICRQAAGKMKVFEKYAFRGMLYLGIGFGTCCVVMINNACWFHTVWGAVIMIDGILYFVAHFKGETWEEEDARMDGLGVDSKKLQTTAATKAMGII